MREARTEPQQAVTERESGGSAHSRTRMGNSGAGTQRRRMRLQPARAQSAAASTSHATSPAPHLPVRVVLCVAARSPLAHSLCSLSLRPSRDGCMRIGRGDSAPAAASRVHTPACRSASRGQLGAKHRIANRDRYSQRAAQSTRASRQHVRFCFTRCIRHQQPTLVACHHGPIWIRHAALQTVLACERWAASVGSAAAAQHTQWCQQQSPSIEQSVVHQPARIKGIHGHIPPA